MNKFLRSGKYKLIFAFVFVTLFFASQASAQINAILTKIDEHRKALTTLRADVKMAKYNPSLDESDTSNGKIMFVTKTAKQDYLFRIDWQAPRNEILAVVKGKYVAYNQKTNQAWTGEANSKEAKNKGGSVLKFLSMSKKELQDNYKTEYLGQEELVKGLPTWHLKFTPNNDSDYKSAEVWVDGNGMILQAQLLPKSGDWSLFRLSNLEKNITLNTANFVVALPKNVAIVKG